MCSLYKCYVLSKTVPLLEKILLSIWKRGSAYEGSCSEVYLEKAFEGQELPLEKIACCRKAWRNVIDANVSHTLTTDDLKLMCSH